MSYERTELIVNSIQNPSSVYTAIAVQLYQDDVLSGGQSLFNTSFSS